MTQRLPKLKECSLRSRFWRYIRCVCYSSCADQQADSSAAWHGLGLPLTCVATSTIRHLRPHDIAMSLRESNNRLLILPLVRPPRRRRGTLSLDSFAPTAGAKAHIFLAAAARALAARALAVPSRGALLTLASALCTNITAAPEVSRIIDTQFARAHAHACWTRKGVPTQQAQMEHMLHVVIFARHRQNGTRCAIRLRRLGSAARFCMATKSLCLSDARFPFKCMHMCFFLLAHVLPNFAHMPCLQTFGSMYFDLPVLLRAGSASCPGMPPPTHQCLVPTGPCISADSYRAL